jgi:hypothetical protein
MFNYIIEVQFLPETSPENVQDNKKALQTIQITKERLNKIDTKGQTPDVQIFGIVGKHGLISGQRYQLMNQLDAELVRRFDAALAGR